MKLIKVKKIDEINEKFYQIVKIKCDCCDKEINGGELYLEASYCNSEYDDMPHHTQLCKDCIKDNIYDIFMEKNNTNFYKYIYRKNPTWYKYDWIYDDEDNRKVIGEENEQT